MPMYELECGACRARETVLLRISEYDEFRKSVADSDWMHFVDGTVCGTLLWIPQRVNVYSHSGAYPFDTHPTLLPPVRGADGKWRPQIATVHNRAEHLALLKKHGLTEIETPGEKLTQEPANLGDTTIRDAAREDAKVYHQMLRDPSARRRVISEAVHKKNLLFEKKTTGVIHGV